MLNTLKKKDKLHSLNTLEVIDTEECGFWNAQKLLFHFPTLHKISVTFKKKMSFIA